MRVFKCSLTEGKHSFTHRKETLVSNPFSSPQFESQPQQPAPGYAASVAAGEEPQKKKGGCLKWGLGIFAVLVIGGALTNLGEDSEDTTGPAENSAVVEEVADEQAGDPAADEAVDAEAEEAPADDVPLEYSNALRAAQNYVDIMPFSYNGLYDQLTSEYGSGFTPEAAQYAVDNVDADWMAEAVEAAENYQETIPMSRDQLINQLTSEYGSQFTWEEAEHAVNSIGL
ncbi:Hypothetical Protein NG00_00438 [Corynebacterium camporealensis]|uniref:Uncharacterized protein n=1 Tax=Corynebacterium camporealensis TaxID=161896 RepID=A0A0F6T9U4_9CORY|nr:protein of unknown function (DUF1535) [Corynebacterium camporealensis]AVH87766.1 Hypothetical Protein NG00_00438 [Corynebacterium camporealensis]